MTGPQKALFLSFFLWFVLGFTQTGNAGEPVFYLSADGQLQTANTGQAVEGFNVSLSEDRNGVANSAMRLDGSAYLTANGVPTTVNVYTFATWYKIDPQAGGNGAFVMQTSGDLGNVEELNQFGLQYFEGMLGARHNSALGATLNPAVANTPDGAWHHFASSFDGVSIKLYKDGELIYTQAVNSIATNFTPELTIGCFNFEGTYQGQFNGWLDEVYVFHEALSACEVYALYSGGCACTPATLEPPHCGAAFGTNSFVKADFLACATDYHFKFENQNTGETFYHSTGGVYTIAFFNAIDGLVNGFYNVSVATIQNEVLMPYGPECTIFWQGQRSQLQEENNLPNTLSHEEILNIHEVEDALDYTWAFTDLSSGAVFYARSMGNITTFPVEDLPLSTEKTYKVQIRVEYGACLSDCGAPLSIEPPLFDVESAFGTATHIFINEPQKEEGNEGNENEGNGTGNEEEENEGTGEGENEEGEGSTQDPNEYFEPGGISFETQFVNLKILDVSGREVYSMENIEQTKDFYQKIWHIAGLGRGIYVIRISDQFQSIQRRVLFDGERSY